MDCPIDPSAVFAYILKLIRQPEAIEFVADFKAVVWKTVRAKLPSVNLRWTQSLENGLRWAHRTNPELKTKCRQVMSLNLQPHEKIEKRFNSIKRTCIGKIQKFCKYFERNWINSKTWPPSQKKKTVACLGKMIGQITTSKVRLEEKS